MKLKIHALALLICIGAGQAAEEQADSAPQVDRVEFPKGYEKFDVLRVVNKKEEQKVVTVYGNARAASITNSTQLPFPNGSVIVMETARALKGPDGQQELDANGNFRKDKVLGLHVMRRGKDFGADYGTNRSGEWEFVEYRADGSYITPPEKSFACAQCHIKAGEKRDFVYRGRLIPETGK